MLNTKVEVVGFAGLGETDSPARAFARIVNQVRSTASLHEYPATVLVGHLFYQINKKTRFTPAVPEGNVGIQKYPMVGVDYFDKGFPNLPTAAQINMLVDQAKILSKSRPQTKDLTNEEADAMVTAVLAGSVIQVAGNGNKQEEKKEEVTTVSNQQLVVSEKSDFPFGPVAIAAGTIIFVVGGLLLWKMKKKKQPQLSGMKRSRKNRRNKRR